MSAANSDVKIKLNSDGDEQSSLNPPYPSPRELDINQSKIGSDYAQANLSALNFIRENINSSHPVTTYEKDDSPQQSNSEYEEDKDELMVQAQKITSELNEYSIRNSGSLLTNTKDINDLNRIKPVLQTHTAVVQDDLKYITITALIFLLITISTTAYLLYVYVNK